MRHEPPSEAILRQLHKNLQILQEREAKYANNAPLDLLNQIEDHQTAIALTEQALAGEVTASDWAEALKPLLVNIQGRQSEAAGVAFGDVGRDIIVSIIAGRDVYYAEVHHHYAAEKPVAPPPAPNTAPPPPKNFVPRPTEFDRLHDLLLSKAEETRTVGITTALQGGGGFGKTTLAMALCHDTQVQGHFTDGVLWLTLGEQPKLLPLVVDQIELLTHERAGFTTLNPATARLRELLTGKRLLLVLDDIWDAQHAEPFLQTGPGCACLLTTRRQDIVTRLGAKAVDVNEMKTTEAADLLVKWLPQPPQDRRPVEALARFLGEWPLLVELAGAQLRESVETDRKPLPQAIAALRKRLERKGFTYLDDRSSETRRNRAISLSLDVSLDRLGEWRARYLDLAVFPEDTDIPFATLERLWAKTAGLDDIDAEDALKAMQRLSLFTRYDPEKKTVRLHDVIRRYLVEQQDDLPGLHADLLNAHRPARPSPLVPDPTAGTPAWADLPEDEPYLWDQLVYHLTQADLTAELLDTIKDLRYLAVKTYRRTPYAVEADLLAAEDVAPADETLRLLRRNFGNAGHLLARCQTMEDVTAHLCSRLMHLEPFVSHCQSLLHHLETLPPRLFARHPLPDIPHPALIRTLTGHSDAVSSCAVSADGSIIVSASADKTLKVWDGQTGREQFILTGHSDIVRDCTVSGDGGLIVSASNDKSLKVWDGQTGQERFSLTGHSDPVRGCAVSADGGLIVSASGDQTLKVWDGQTGQERFSLIGHSAYVNSCTVSADGRIIVSASADETPKYGMDKPVRNGSV